MSIPIIKIQLEGMRLSVLHAFSQQQLEISEELERALKRECTPEKIQEYVDAESRKVVEDSVRDAVRKWWLTSESGQKLIKEAVSKKMEEEAEIYRGWK